MEKTERDAIIRLVKREVVPAIGCTEPIAVALCVSKAAQLLGKEPEKIEVLLSANILKNAVAALQDRFKRRYPGVPFIRIRVFVNSSDNTEIQISNNGVPVPDDAADRLFDPFFTTRPGGTGVGLALSRQIMRAHNGTLRLDRSVSGITTFILTI